MNQANKNQDNHSEKKLTAQQVYHQNINIKYGKPFNKNVLFNKKELFNKTAVNWTIAVISLMILGLGTLLFYDNAFKNLKLSFDYKTNLLLVTTLVLLVIVLFSKQTRLIIFGIFGIALTGGGIQLLSSRGLQSSSLFYIGLPLLLAYLFKHSKISNTNTIAILKGITVVILLSAPVLQEGFICILMAAPLFYIIGGVAGLIIDYNRKKQLSKLQLSPLFLLLALMSLEGTHPALTFDRQHTVRVEKVVSASSDEIKKQLNKPLVLGNKVPTFLKIFPFPTQQASTQYQGGTQVGDKTALHFVYNKHFFFNPKIGDLIYEVTATGDNFIESKVTQDESYVSSYLNWQNSKVSWQAIDASHTKVVWEISYERKLDPAWYFGTLEYFTTGLMANALIKYAATPENARD